MRSVTLVKLRTRANAALSDCLPSYRGRGQGLVVPNARRDRFRTGFQHPRPHAPWSNASSDAQRI